MRRLLRTAPVAICAFTILTVLQTASAGAAPGSPVPAGPVPASGAGFVADRSSSIAGEALAARFGTTPGFAAVEVRDDRIIVRWQGSPPPQVRAAVAQARAGGAVDIVPAKYSAAELDAAARRLMSAPGSDVLAAGPTSDMARLRVRLSTEEKATPNAGLQQLEQNARVARLSSVPIVVEPGGGYSPAADWRWDEP